MSPRFSVGDRLGGFEILIARTRPGRGYRVRCVECGTYAYRDRGELEVGRPCRCTGGRRQSESTLALSRARHGVPALCGLTRTDDDPACLALIAERGAMSTAEIGAALGVSGERIRQLERRALGKFRRLLEQAGIDEEDIREWLARPSLTHPLADLPHEDPLS